MSEFTKKSERLASAVYLITNFFSDQEPLKWRLRVLFTDMLSERVKDKSNLTMEALSLFFVAKNVGLVSEINYEIFINELLKLKQEVEKSLETTFFRETTMSERVLPEPQRTEYIKDKHKEFGTVSVKKNSRQNTIVTILKRKREIMIKDISPLIPSCSEKTIQRELLAMVRTGILKKIGEKRWSRYSLA